MRRIDAQTLDLFEHLWGDLLNGDVRKLVLDIRDLEQELARERAQNAELTGGLENILLRSGHDNECTNAECVWDCPRHIAANALGKENLP